VSNARTWTGVLLLCGALLVAACGDESVSADPITERSLPEEAATVTPEGGEEAAATTDLETESPEGPEVLVDSVGCASVPLYDRAADPAERGPWPVGVTTVKMGRLDVEVLYPASPGSEAGLDPMEVDIRYALPASEQAKVTDDVRPHQSCDCYRDLPLDDTQGPYPLVLFVHGTASWRTQSLSLMEHWASRGFVVASADHPGLWLSDILSNVCGLPPSGAQDLQGDLAAVLAGFTNGTEGLEFLSGRVDLARVAVAGHSAGANAATSAAVLDGVQVVISMAGSGATNVSALDSALFLGGMADSVVSFSETEKAYNGTSVARRLVGITGGGHLVFSDICELTNDNGQDLVEIATEAGVCGTMFAAFLFDCAASTIPAEDSNA
ncbi:MAG: hypothetical protein VX938_12555, partial [Myxococcota bacterium]|nr:hypothetical protein [Myxococcota bacterium]